MADGAATEPKGPAPARRAPADTDAGRSSAAGPGGLAVTPEAPGSIGRLGVQAKAVVGGTGDPLEREADAVADSVLRAGPAPVAPTPGREEAVRRQPAREPPPISRPTNPDPLPPPTPAPSAEERPGGGGAAAEDEPAGAAPGGTVSERVQALLDASAGRGRPLAPPVRTALEGSFRRNFSDVRIHDDAAAADAARALNAVAFTRGRDIYFAAGAYDPDSEAGRRVLAHELTHVVQQTGRTENPFLRRQPAAAPPVAAPAGSPPVPTPDTGGRLRRQGGKKSTPAPAAKKPGPRDKEEFAGKKGRVRTSGAPEMEMFDLPVPEYKRVVMTTLVPGKDLVLKPTGVPRSDTQIENWTTAAKPTVQKAVTERLKQLPAPAGTTGGAHFLKYGKAAKTQYLIGTEAEIVDRLVRPPWDKQGNPESFDVDHKLELQLGGADKDPPDNLWLLESSANRDAGRSIAESLKVKVAEVLDEVEPQLKKTPSYTQVRKSYKVYVNVGKLVGTPAGKGKASVFWESKDLTADLLTKPLERVPAEDLPNLQGTANELSVFSVRSGGSQRRSKPGAQNAWGKGSLFEVKDLRWKAPGKHTGGSGVEVGEATGTAFKDNKLTREGPFTLPLRSIQGIGYGGYLDTGRYGLVAKMFSPVKMDDLYFDVRNGFQGRGRILPASALLAGRADIGYLLDERGVGIYAALTGDAFNLPGPFQIRGGVLELRAQYPAGLTAIGRINFAIADLATGWVEASIGTSESFGVAGELNFDTSLFTEARLGVRYRDGKWAVTGRLGIGEGKVTGIRRASAGVTIEGDKVTADGEFESSLKGLKAGKLGFAYDPATGMTIDGLLTLGELPGIRGGTVKAKVRQRPGGEGWSLAGEVTAEPAVPGITGTITGKYEDGAFAVLTDLAYQRGLLDGRLRLGITNQQPGPDGQPAGPPQPGLLLVYGRGQVTVKLTPWLIGTAVIDIRPNGTIAVAGRIGLPDRFELFARRELSRPIFSLGIDIPLVGVAVAGQRVGIFATIRGGLDLVAGIGPGLLLGTGIEVSYDPEREDATRVEGDTRLSVPADAGLRLFVQGGAGVGIPLVSATAGVELGGQLGLRGELGAGVHLVWTRSAGLVIDAEASLSVSPVFRFTADLYVLVEAGIGPFRTDLYNRKWKLAAFDYGSSLTFGVVLPVHAAGGDFQFGLDRVRFVYPAIDAGDVAKGVIRKAIDG